MLENLSYVPTLAIRASEMNGLEYLPGATKDRMTPCFLLAPWARSNSLGKAIERIERAFPSRPYILDIDRNYPIVDLDIRPQGELANLKSAGEFFANWREFVTEYENVIPCLQTNDQDRHEIEGQIDELQNIGRQFCVRIERERYPNNTDECVAALNSVGSADYCMILEGGWARDPLTLAAWYQGIISVSLSEMQADVPIVVSCTSMPKMFSDFTGTTRVDFSNRELIRQVARITNRANIVYGDWGSTRPREPRQIMRRPVDRIDYATSDAWYIVRNGVGGWSFVDAARELINRGEIWSGDLQVWGEEMIRQTAINQNLGINSPQKNVAARVNIHLHRQTFYNEEDVGQIDFDDEWEDYS